jgi:hypothetical protein
VAVCVSDFHDNLKTNKSSGIFAAGGPWELSLRECLSGEVVDTAAAATADSAAVNECMLSC